MRRISLGFVVDERWRNEPCCCKAAEAMWRGEWVEKALRYRCVLFQPSRDRIDPPCRKICRDALVRRLLVRDCGDASVDENNNDLGTESHERVPRTCILSVDLDMDIRAVQRGHARVATATVGRTWVCVYLSLWI